MKTADILIVTGIVLFIFGVFYKFDILHLGRLPGDILIRRGNFVFYFPLASGIIIGLIISLLIALLRR